MRRESLAPLAGHRRLRFSFFAWTNRPLRFQVRPVDRQVDGAHGPVAQLVRARA